MSEEKTLIEKVKELVFEKETPKEEVKETPVELAEVTTADGVVLKYENLEAGTAIAVVDAEGVESPASGDYTLEDGTVIVTEEGAVVEVKEVEVEEKEEEELAEEVNPLEEKVTALESKLDEVLAKFETLSEGFAAFKAEPAEEEVKLSKKAVEVSSRENALQGIKNFRNKK